MNRRDGRRYRRGAYARLAAEPDDRGDGDDRTRRDQRDDRDDGDRFSQRDDDRAGRSWHGMNSEYEIEDVGRFHRDEDEDQDGEPRRDRTRAASLATAITERRSPVIA